MMCSRDQFKRLFVAVFIAVTLVSGCATTKTPYGKITSYGTWNFSNSEVKILPNISLRKILSATSESDSDKVQIQVKAHDIDGIAVVKKIANPDDVIVTDAHGNEMKVKIAKITEIQTIRWMKKSPNEKTRGKTAEAAAEVLLYAPVIPIAVVSWPILKALGLDAGKNAADNGKALMAYGGMSKDELIMHVGVPSEKYFCNSNDGNGKEVWIYKKNQVLRGGRALFIHTKDGKVYYTSYNTTFFNKSNNCTKLTR